MTFPFDSLPENLAAFCAVLRRDHRFRIGPRELIDAAHGVEFADIGNERAVRNVLRPILSKTPDDMQVFDAAFERFFGGGEGRSLARDGGPEGTSSQEDGADGADEVDAEAPPRWNGRTEAPPLQSAPVVGDEAFAAGAVHEVSESEDDATATLLHGSYSPLEGTGEPVVLEPASRTWLEAAAALASRVHAAASRKWQPARRGPRFDFRLTLRTSLHTGGEPVTPRWRARARRRSRFVLLIDGSRSMSASAAPALDLAVALSAVSPATETFTFSTMLRRVTRDTRRAAAGERRTVDLRQAWGGGTTIGVCLNEFLRVFGDRLLSPDTVVIIFSDGLDVGSPDLLRESMARLARRAAAIVWINPLLETTSYQPTALGMSLARPHVTLLTSVRDANGLRSVARRLRLH